MRPPTLEIVAVYNGVSTTKSSAFSARASCSGAEVAAACGEFVDEAGALAGFEVEGGIAVEDCSIGFAGGALRGAYQAVKIYITAIDMTKARMTRFSIQDYLRIPI